jgi:hypothetical protein
MSFGATFARSTVDLLLLLSLGDSPLFAILPDIVVSAIGRKWGRGIDPQFEQVITAK